MKRSLFLVVLISDAVLAGHVSCQIYDYRKKNYTQCKEVVFPLKECRRCQFAQSIVHCDLDVHFFEWNDAECYCLI